VVLVVRYDLMPVLDDPVLRPAGTKLGRSDDVEAAQVLL
jgi:hypothetical protein